MNNDQLKQKYDQMHSQGKSAWFDDGEAERRAIFDMGSPWIGKTVLEIGCGEGDLMNMIAKNGGIVTGCDYSEVAIATCHKKHPHLDAMPCHYHDVPQSRNNHYDVLVMQGVLEHMDDWQESLTDMISHFHPGRIITSMPSFHNILGIVRHTLHMLGAVMSKTDLHYINSWEVEEFCIEHNYGLMTDSIEIEWGNGAKMIEDLRTRIPLALKDGGIPFDMPRINDFLDWLRRTSEYFDHPYGAVTVYEIVLL